MTRRAAERSVPARLVAFAVALVVAGLLGAGLGVVAGPIDVGGDHAEAPTVPDQPTPVPTDHGGPHG